MRIRRLPFILPALLALAACDSGTLADPQPIHGAWKTPITLFRGTGSIDRAEHRYTFRTDGTYESTTLGFDEGRVVYEGELTGEYRLEPGGLVQNVQTWRWRAAETSGWQNEVVGDKGVFAPPMPYTVDGDLLVLHYGPSSDEHGNPIPAKDRVYTRR